MLVPLTATLFSLQQAAEPLPPASGTARTVVRVLLGALIVVLLSYIVIEQVGSWRRRRSHRG